MNHPTPDDYARVLKMPKRDIIAAILVYREVRSPHPSWDDIDNITALALKQVSKRRLSNENNSLHHQI